MATYYVDGSSGNDNSGNGSSGSPWKTLGKAYNSSSAGDTIKVRTAVYTEKLTLGKSNQTWEADSGHTPRLDGLYGPNFGNDYNRKPNQLPGGGQFSAMVAISGDGITWDGIDIKHIAGQGIVTGTGADGATIKNCDIHYCYSALVNVQGKATTVENVDMRYGSLKKRATSGDGAGRTQTACMVKGQNNVIKNCTLKYVYAEGVSLDKKSSGGKVLNCRIEDTAHAALYINDHSDAVMDGNIVVQTGLYPEWQGKKNSVGIICRDECGGGPIHQKRQIITNNIVVNCSTGIKVTSNRDSCAGGDGNLTRLDEGYIAFNTIVNCEGEGIQFDERSSLPYRNSIFENNIVVVTKGGGVLAKGSFTSNGVQFRNNIWYHHNGSRPDAKFRSSTDSYANPNLSNPNVDVVSDLSVDNYKLTSSSSDAINRASDGSRFNNLTPPAVTKDFFGASRPGSTNRDIGAHEFDATEPLPDEGIKIYFVDGKNGNDDSGNGKSNNPWKTISKAVNQANPGDTIKVRTATYREVLGLNKDNLTVQADDGHQPVLDGGYNEGLFQGGQLPGPENYLPGAAQANMIGMRANGLTVDGLTIQNVGGVGIGVSGSRGTIRNCRIDFCYGGGLIINGGSNIISGPLVENNTITRCSVKYYHPDRDGAGPAGVQGTLNIVSSENAIVRHNIVAYSYGEGINIDKGSSNALVEGNVVHTCNHVHIYFNRSINSVARNNFIYHLYLPEHLGNDRDAPAGIVIGDEKAGASFPHSRGAIIYNNIVVGMGTSFMIRNGTNYDTQTDECYIGYNTFVGRRQTRVGIDIAENKDGRLHGRTIFENNIILQNSGVIGKANGNLSGITFRNNLWSESPPSALRGQQDRIGDPRLANAGAEISGTSPGATNADPFNYRLTRNSTLAIGRASDGSAANNFRPPTIDRDFFNSSRDNAPDIGSHEFGGETATLSANFSIGPGQGQGMVPHTVDFTDRTTSSATLVEWSWDFGDGSSSPERNPSHTYMNPGSYNVSLTVRDSDGQTDTIVEPGLVTALLVIPPITSDDFRRFVLVEEATSDVLAFGSQYPDLSCVLLWNSEPFHILNYNTVEDVAGAYADPGIVGFYWLDPVYEPLVEDNYPIQ